MTSPRVRLYTYAMSPYAAKVHCFLLFKRIPFECFYINPLRVSKDLPVGRQIPVVTIDGVHRNDSTPIGLWLDERFPDAPRLLPDDGPGRKKLLEIDDWITNRLIPGSFRSYPGDGIDKFLNGWKLSRVMGRTASGGLPAPLRWAWPLLVTNVGFVKRLVAQADDGLPVRESKFALYRELIDRLEGGPFLAGRDSPSFPDLAAYPQFALYWVAGFRHAEDITCEPELMAWLERMRPWVDGCPPLMPAPARVRDLP